MNSTFSIAITGVLLFFNGFFSLQTHANGLNRLKPYQVEALVISQQQSMSWSIAGNLSGGNPNILSELIWDDLYGVGFELNPRWKLGSNWLFSVPFNTGYTINGEVTDSDYEGDNKASRVFFTEVSANGSYSCLTYPHIGYCFNLGRHFQLIPQAGYVISAQHLFLKQKNEINNNLSLNSSYSTRWFGPGATLETQYVFSKRISLAMLMDYYQVDYKANANWNLIETLKHPVSFSHKAKGYGIEYTAQLNYKIKQSVQLIFKLNHSMWSTGFGIDNLYKNDGTVVQTRLNDVTYKVISAKVGLNFSF